MQNWIDTISSSRWGGVPVSPLAAQRAAGSQSSGLQRFLAPIGEACTNAVVCLLTWQARTSERQHLHSLDPYMLKDIGLSRGDVLREVSKPFWER